MSGLCSVLFGCAATAADSARQETLQVAMRQHEYRRPCRFLWPTVRQVVSERGITPVDSGPYTLETAWSAEGSTAARYYAQAVPTPGEGCRVVINRASRWDQTQPPVLEHAVAMELAVVERIEPETAAAYREVANEQAAAAR